MKIKKIFVNGVCLIILSGITVASVYAFSPTDKRSSYATWGAIITVALFPIYNHVVNLAGASHDSIKEWVESVFICILIFGWMSAVDFFLQSAAGFAITLFAAVPAMLAAIFGLLRAVLIKLLCIENL